MHSFRNVLFQVVAIASLSSFAAALPSASKVILVVEENHSYESVMYTSAMPYLKYLASHNAVASQYYAEGHPSIGNYFWLTAGKPVSWNDSLVHSIDTDNIVRDLLLSGATWKSYAENIPYRGYTGGNAYPYYKRHNPLAYFTDVANSSLKYNLFSTNQLSSDITNHALPRFSFVAPNAYHDGHDGSLGAADYWLQQRIKPILSLPDFQPGGSGLLIISFDESVDSDCRPSTCGSTHPYGGRVVTIFVGPKVKHGYSSGTRYFHRNLLKTISVVLGLADAPGYADGVNAMSDMFAGY